MITYINLFLYTFSNFLIGLVWPICLTKRFQKITYVGYALIYYVIFLLPSYVKFFTVPYSVLFEIMYYSALIGLMIFLIIAFRDELWKKILFFIIIMAAMIVGESLSSAMLTKLGVGISVDFNTIEATWLMVSVIATDMIIMTPIAYLWNKFIKREGGFSWKMGFALAIPLSHWMLISATASLKADGESQLTTFGLIILILGICLEAVNLFLICLQRKKADLEQEIAELTEVMREDEEQYRVIEEELDAIAKERHDRNNQIAVVRGLIANKDKEGALTFLANCH